MTIDKAIKNEEEIAIQQIEKANALDNIPLFGMSKDDIEEIKECYKCSKEHEQLAEWLKELQAHREAWTKAIDEIKQWYWQSDKQKLAKDPCVVDAMVDLFIRTIKECRPKEGDEE